MFPSFICVQILVYLLEQIHIAKSKFTFSFVLVFFRKIY